ncbi:Metal-dependent hydrolase, beta-lactamase superfamily II [Sediminibacillus albus]|uniref:Metal-dependent hydrolase, beta-lactamase superfamily II n=2 Tax=Sediminibacillus albus TaxID=407036 RepID=A0A1G8VPM0_9BACI|nr:Metal-dependent hydrolase, beta-lactamase superfamily II [Sediminibacillus albus]
MIIRLFILLCLMLSAPASMAMAETSIGLKDNEIYYAFFNLPDGEAALLEGNGGAVLINTGSPQSEEALFNQLEELEVTEINTLILTKQLMDYCGNARQLIEQFQPKSVAYTGKLSNTCQTQLENTNIEVWDNGKSIEMPMGGTLTVLKAEESGEMTLDITYGKTSMLFLSNSHIEDEDELLQYELDPQIIKIGDYARGKSPSGYLLDKIDPHIGIIYNCKQGLPNEGLMERLNESWIDVYHLKQVGTTIIRLNETDYEVLSFD